MEVIEICRMVAGSFTEEIKRIVLFEQTFDEFMFIVVLSSEAEKL